MQATESMNSPDDKLQDENASKTDRPESTGELQLGKVIDTEAGKEDETPKWQPLKSLQRRVAGVLVEKSKTTPDSYPMTVNTCQSGWALTQRRWQ